MNPMHHPSPALPARNTAHLLRALWCLFLIGSIHAQEETGFELLFNGKDLAGWGGPVDAFEVKDGALVCRPDEGGTLYTRKRYADFILRFEFQLPAQGQAGIALRYPGSGNPAYVGMCQIQIRDESAEAAAKLDPRQRNGAAYGLVAAKAGSLRPTGAWNVGQITVRGSTLDVELNGTSILKADLSTVTEFMDNHPHPGKGRTSGHVGIVCHTDPVRFRNVRIKPLR